MGDLDRLATKAAVLKFLADRVYEAYVEARDAVAQELGAQGRKNAVIGGNKIATVSVTETGRVTISNEEALTAWVEEHFPTEVYEKKTIRKAFLDQIKKTSAAAGEPCAPDGTLDVPGVSVSDPHAMVRKTPGGAEVIEELWRTGRLSIDGEIKEIE